ncbi:MAG: family transcriptional regulator, cyclic receptor protein [Solirubrobacterales bacterium]|jgi:CRP-like cAMP-binding protein|nr:family transcriptional regulator, cyclic receptor protein [Solirubrobacterales bacterium]
MDTTQLKRIPLFSDASDEELKKVAAFAEAKEVDQGKELVKEGGFSRALMAIEEGTAEVSRDGEHIADLGPGDVFGEAGMLDDSQRSATVTATSRVKLISMGHFEVQRLKKDAPGVFARIEQLVEERSD